jgi:hypothetical protein
MMCRRLDRPTPLPKRCLRITNCDDSRRHRAAVVPGEQAVRLRNASKLSLMSRTPVRQHFRRRDVLYSCADELEAVSVVHDGGCPSARLANDLRSLKSARLGGTSTPADQPSRYVMLSMRSVVGALLQPLLPLDDRPCTRHAVRRAIGPTPGRDASPWALSHRC